jgi:hypothetical protein
VCVGRITRRFTSLARPLFAVQSGVVTWQKEGRGSDTELVKPLLRCSDIAA